MAPADQGQVDLQAIGRTADKLRAWANRRIDEHALDLARLYQASRDTFVSRIRHVYDTFLLEEPTLMMARRGPAAAALEQAIQDTVDGLVEQIARQSVEKLTELRSVGGERAATEWGKALGVDLKALPQSTQDVLLDVTTTVVGGGTFFDRLMHMGDGFKGTLTQRIRGGLLGGEPFHVMRDRIMKDFGVDRLAEPKFSAYGSVMTYKNEARREFNLLMKSLGDKSEAMMVWYAIVEGALSDTTTPGCAARHGLRLDEDLAGDTPPRHINSFAPWTRISGRFIGGVRRLYRGQIRELKTAGGNVLAVTAHHPVLTASGMRPAYSLSKGDVLVCDRRWVKEVSVLTASSFPMIDSSRSAPNIKYAPVTIEQAFQAFPVSRRSVSVDGGFHGDTSGWDGYIDIVAINSELLDNMLAERSQQFRNLIFEPEDSLEIAHIGLGLQNPGLSRAHTPPGRFPSLLELPLHYLSVVRPRRSLTPLESLGFGPSSDLDAVFYEASLQHVARDARFVRELFERCPALVAFDEVTEIRDLEFSGHVYDLQSVSGSMVAEGICVSNCRCTIALLEQGTDLSDFQAAGDAWLKQHGYSRKAAMLEESEHLVRPSANFSLQAHEGWPWGSNRIVPAFHAADKPLPTGHRYQAVPWRQLPALAMGRQSETPWLEAGYVPRALLWPDQALLRVKSGGALARPEVLTEAGWRPLVPKTGRWIPTLTGSALDSADIGPPWDAVASRPYPETLRSWPALRTLLLPSGRGDFSAAVLAGWNADALAADALDMGEVSGWQRAGTAVDAVRLALSRGPTQPDPHLAVADHAGVAVICRLADGVVTYQRDQLEGAAISPYQRAAMVVPAGGGKVWAIRPRGVGLWSLPGGHMDGDENAGQAATREFEEETGIPVAVTRFLGILYRPWATTAIFMGEPVGEAGDPASPDETDAVAAISPNDLDPAEHAWLWAHRVLLTVRAVATAGT